MGTLAKMDAKFDGTPKAWDNYKEAMLKWADTENITPPPS